MIIRVILIVAIAIVLWWFIRQRISTRGQAWGKIVALLLFVFALVSIISPNSTNHIAHYVGVGRGADLLLYVLTVVFIAHLVSYYLQRRDDAAKVVKITRRLAILEANDSRHNKERMK